MARRLMVAAACALVIAGTVLAGAARPAVPREVEIGIFYYPWWGTSERDGAWYHWSQNAHTPPADIASAYYPSRGPYSSGQRSLVRDQMAEIARMGVGTVIVSWWGHGSLEDGRLPLVLREARRARLRVAVHIEPWPGRTPASAARAMAELEDRGVTEFYVYDSTRAPADEWAQALQAVPGAVVYANTSLVGEAKRGGFQGVYTYDVFMHSGGGFTRLCRQARRVGLLCAPSVGPGYDARRAAGDTRRQPRENGERYDAMWRRALRARPDGITITSYNEWHEGTQIEPARVVGKPYASYEGAYGLTGPAAETAYVDRTAFWVSRVRGA